MSRNYYPGIDVSLFAPLLLAAGLSMITAAAALAQNRAAIGCEAVKIDNMSTPVSFDELVCRCFNKCASPPPVPATSSTPSPSPPTPSAATANTTPPPPAPRPPTAPDQRKFRVFEGRDVNGYDFRDLSNVTFEKCIDACRSDATCSSFSFDKWNRRCFLKNTVPSEVRIEPKSIVAVMASATPNVSRAPVTFQKYINAVFPDRPYQEVSGRSYEACERICNADGHCEAFTFAKAASLCKLIARPSEYFRDASARVDSGVKRQLPP